MKDYSSITADDMSAIAKKYLDNKKAATIIIKPEKVVKKQVTVSQIQGVNDEKNVLIIQCNSVNKLKAQLPVRKGCLIHSPFEQ